MYPSRTEKVGLGILKAERTHLKPNSLGSASSDFVTSPTSLRCRSFRDKEKGIDLVDSFYVHSLVEGEALARLWAAEQDLLC